MRYFVNSVIVSVSSTVIAVLLAVFAGYAISRFEFRGRKVFSLAVLSTQMFPGILFLLPLYRYDDERSARRPASPSYRPATWA